MLTNKIVLFQEIAQVKFGMVVVLILTDGVFTFAAFKNDFIQITATMCKIWHWSRHLWQKRVPGT